MRYTQEMIIFLKEISYKKSLDYITSEFNKKFNLSQSRDSIAGTMKRYKIKTHNNTIFKKGHTPWNKGVSTNIVTSSCFKKIIK